MDDFLGTSIQYAEQEILRLEREHAEQMERTASELIQNGFLDTDYEDSDTESTLTDYSDSRSADMQEPADEKSIVDTSQPDTETETQTETADSLSVPVASQHESEVESEVGSNFDVDDERESEVESDRASLKRLMESLITDIRGLAMMLLLLVALQVANEPADEQFDDDDRYDKGCPRVRRHTQIQYYWHQDQGASFLNDENQEEDEEEKECPTRTLNFDVVTTTFDHETKTWHQSKSLGHAIRFDDLFCDDDVAGNMENPVMQVRRVSAPRQIPRLLLQFGAGLKSPQVMRIFKETVADTGRHLVRNHGLTALVISFAGIAAVTAASSGLDDLL